MIGNNNWILKMTTKAIRDCRRPKLRLRPQEAKKLILEHRVVMAKGKCMHHVIDSQTESL